MRDLALLTARVAFGSFVASHGAQKLFGAFNGPGLKGATQMFEGMGLQPSKPMAVAAASGELVGGALVATGAANPLGSILIGSAMIPAASVHRANGFYAMNGGFELPLTNVVAALGFAAAGPGKFRMGPSLPARAAVVIGVGAGAVAAYAVSRITATQRSAALGEQASSAQDDEVVDAREEQPVPSS